jgi:hypothetical protein
LPTFESKFGSMFLKNRSFNDEDSLMEALFDFGLGDPTPETRELMRIIEDDLAENETFINYRKTLSEEDRQELDAGERSIRLAEALMQRYDSFTIHFGKLWGLKGGERTLLYEIELI